MQRFGDFTLGMALFALAVGGFNLGCSRKQVKDSPEEGTKKAAAARAEEESKASTPATEGPAAQEGAAWNGHDRLASDVVPEHYEIDLLIDPSKETFRGRVEIEVTLESAAESIRMHANDLEFSTVEAQYQGNSIAVEPRTVEKGGLIMEFGEELEPGELELEFRYSGPLDEVPEGLYRAEDEGNWYAFTQFQPLEAREAFPCFDEPRFKTPYEVRLTVPEGMVAAANGPKIETEPLEEAEMEGEDGEPIFDGTAEESGELVTWEFAETEPLPTYLVAFAVGDFDVVEAGDVLEEDEQLDVPVRVLTTKGNGSLASYALRKTSPLVRSQEEYFGSEFPYQKMDLVAVPNFRAGAMENVGLVTYRESVLLMDEEHTSVEDEYRAQAYMAHEYAHMWFGNSVTLSWWDDLWLNEAFATWMGRRTLEEVSPELEPQVEAVQQLGGVIRSDSLEKSRAIRQPIESAGDVYNAFDSITYRKGAAVLRMFEHWIGSEQFRSGVRAYIDEHTHGVAQTSDLMEALAEASGKSVGEVVAPFVDQPGAPLVTVSYDREACRTGEGATLELEQTRYRPVGSDAEVGEPWKIPICFRYGGGEDEGAAGRTCFLFDGSSESPRRETVELETDGCPSWVHPNAGEYGYYHWRVAPEEAQRRTVEAWEEFELNERVALLGHLEALVRARAMEVAEFLEALRTLSGADHRLILEQIIGALHDFHEVVYRGESSSGFRSFAGTLLGRHYERIGFHPSEGESSGAALLRPKVVKAVVNLAGNDEARRRAERTTELFLETPEKVDTSVAKFSMDVAARTGGPSLWRSIRKGIDEANRPDLRASLIGALGHFEEPELARKSLDLFFTEVVRAQNLWRLVGPVSGDPKTVEIAWKWMTENYEAIVDKIGESSAASLPWVGSAFCSQAGKKRVEAFFSSEEHRTVGTERNLAQAVESIEQCIAYRELAEEPVKSHLDE